MWYISADMADKLLPVAARGDIEGACLALLLNCLVVMLFVSSINKLVNIFKKSKHYNLLRHMRYHRWHDENI